MTETEPCARPFLYSIQSNFSFCNIFESKTCIIFMINAASPAVSAPSLPPESLALTRAATGRPVQPRVGPTSHGHELQISPLFSFFLRLCCHSCRLPVSLWTFFPSECLALTRAATGSAGPALRWPEQPPPPAPDLRCSPSPCFSLCLSSRHRVSESPS